MNLGRFNMWCKNCQHGHIPVMRFIKNLGREVSVCPCCNAELSEAVISSKEEQLKEIAKRMGVNNLTFGKEQPKGFMVGKPQEEEEKPYEEAITTENIMSKLAPEVEVIDPVSPVITPEPKAKAITKKKAKK